MVKLFINKNLVFLSKKDPNWRYFVNSFLVKYEEVMKPDKYKVSGRKFTYVKERRELYVDHTSDFIIFSAGLLEIIPKSEYQLYSSGVENTLNTPQLSFDEIIKTLPTFDLRDDQAVAVNKCLLMKRGVIQLPTAVGKSAIIAATIKRLLEFNPNLNALVIAPTLSTVEGINKTLLKNKISSTIYGHPNKELTPPVTTALVQSLVDDTTGSLDSINAVFYDECLPGKAQILLPGYTYARISDIYNDPNIQEVYSYNTETKEYEIKRILHKYKTPHDQKFCRVYYRDNLYRDIRNSIKGFTCTPNHKIWTKTRGYVPAEFLVPGDLIKIDYSTIRDHKALEEHTYCKVDSVIFNTGGVAPFKYNLEIEDNHNYFADNVLVSNCHHLKCDTWNKLNMMLPNVEYALGFSALSIDKSEIYEKDIRNISYDASLIIGSSGRVLMHMDPSYYIEKGIIAMPIVLRVDNYVTLPVGLDESNWHEVVKYGIMSSVRTNKISQVAQIFSKYNRKSLILINEREYAFTLARFLVSIGETKFGISFGAGQGFIYNNHYVDEFNQININYDRINSLDILDKLSNGEINVVIGTSHVDEGVDISELDVVILACGGKKDRRIIQRVGRVLRKSKTGKYAYIVDFTDSGSAVLFRQSKTRLNMYKKEIGVPSNNIFDGICIDNLEDKFKELESLN